jgi:hypothetical protein
MAPLDSKPTKHEFVLEMHEDTKKAAERRAKEAEDRLREATRRFEEQVRTEHKKRDEAEAKTKQIALPLFDEFFDYFDLDPENHNRGGKMTFTHKLNAKLHDNILDPSNFDHHWICAEIIDKKLRCTSYYIFQDGMHLMNHERITITIDNQFQDFPFDPDEHPMSFGENMHQEAPGVPTDLLQHIADHYFKKIEVNIHGSGRMLSAPRIMHEDEKKAIFQTVGFCHALEAL